MFKGKWNQKLSKLFIYLSGYVSFIAFALVGGYTLVKSDDEDLKKTTKIVFIISLIYYALFAVMAIFGHFGSMSSSYYGSGFYTFVSIMNKLIEIAKIVVYAVLMLFVIFKKDNTESKPQTIESHELVETETELGNEDENLENN